MGERDEESDHKFGTNMRRNTLTPLRPILTMWSFYSALAVETPKKNRETLMSPAV